MSFNSSLVLLKDLKEQQYVRGDVGFNSSLVLLKVGRLRLFFEAVGLFQFQPGSTKSYCVASDVLPYVPFQFQPGSTKRMPVPEFAAMR